MQLNADSVSKEKTKEDWMLETIKTALMPKLKSPSTAKFGSMRNYAEDNYGRVYVAIDVDAMNSYGAVLRLTYDVLFDSVQENGLGTIKMIEENLNKKSALARFGSKAMGDWKVFWGFGKPR